MSENKSCPAFLGVHVAEQVLRHTFKDVERMPYGNPGYDFICNHGKRIDVKGSCIRYHENWSDGWMFAINKNTIADYFMCLAFDNRTDLNPLHIWLIPSEDIAHKTGVGISKSTIRKWNKYVLDIDKVTGCCDTMKAQRS